MSKLAKKRKVTWGKKISEAKKGKIKFTKTHIKNMSLSKGKEIAQYDLNNNFIKKFRTARDAMDETGIKFDNISMCLRGKSATAGGFVWKFTNPKHNTGIEPFIDTKKTPIIQYSLDGKFIKEWLSISEASKKLKVNGSGISRCCRKLAKSAGEFYWEYKNK